MPAAAPPTAAAQRHRCREPAVPRETGVGGCVWGDTGWQGAEGGGSGESGTCRLPWRKGGSVWPPGEGELGNMQPRNNGRRHLGELNSSSTHMEYTGGTRGPYTNPTALAGPSCSPPIRRGVSLPPPAPSRQKRPQLPRLWAKAAPRPGPGVPPPHPEPGNRPRVSPPPAVGPRGRVQTPLPAEGRLVPCSACGRGPPEARLENRAQGLGG